MPDQRGSFQERSRHYWRLKYATAIAESACLFMLLAVFLASGFFRTVANAVSATAPDFWSGLAALVLILSAARYLAAFPFTFYRSFILEHQFRLTRRSVADWFKDQAKAGALSYCLGVFLAALFYALVLWQPQRWWWLAGLGWALVSLALAHLAPVLIIPLFFTCSPVADRDMRRRIMALAQKMGVALLDVFEINLSRMTAKANAALVGRGKTRRVLLGDTLRGAYSPEEIEAIIAHEFAHQKLRHLARLTAFNACVVLTGMYALRLLWEPLFGLAQVASLTDLAGFTVIIAFFSVWGFGTQPLANHYSRKLEAAADRLALAATADPQAFISLMEKLAAQNLADRAPSPLARFFFFDHPSIDERIAAARGHA